MAVAVAAVIVALGRSATAAVTVQRDSVGTQQLKKNSVRSPDIAANAVKASEIANNAVRGREIRRNSVGLSDLTGGVRRRLNAAGTPGPPGPPGSNATVNGVAAAGALSGTFPNPSIGSGQVGPDNLSLVPAANLVAGSPFHTIPTNNVTSTTLSNWDESTAPAAFDPAGMHDPAVNPQRLTAPRAGIYSIHGNISWPSNINGRRELEIVATTDQGTVTSSGRTRGQDQGNFTTSASMLASMNAGASARLEATQSSGSGAVITTAEFSMHYVGPRT